MTTNLPADITAALSIAPPPLLPAPSPATATPAPATLSMQAAGESWLSNLETRHRKPAKPATIRTFDSFLRTHINPFFDGVAVESVNNGKLREFVCHLIAKELSPKTIKEIIASTKSLIAAQTNPETGDCLFPRQWRDTVIDAPLIENQSQPIASVRELEDALSVANEFDAAFLALTAGSGVRIGELLAIRIGVSRASSYWNPSEATLTIKTSMWEGIEQAPKTKHSLRTIELCKPLNAFLKTLVAASAIEARSNQFLFSSSFVFGGADPVSETSIRLHLKKYISGGFHSLRRFRATMLRSGRCEEQITRYWLGHSPGQSTTDTYSKLYLDERFRRACHGSFSFHRNSPTCSC
jgi:integrase